MENPLAVARKENARMIYQLTTPCFCAGVVVNGRQVITEAAPCYHQYLNKKLLDVMRLLFWRGEFVWCEKILTSDRMGIKE